MKITALAGGVGGAKFAQGLYRTIPKEDLTVIVNTGDDFEHFGLAVSPDVDTVCYTLAGLENPESGWGRADETWNAISNVKVLGGPSWFQLGDRDLATHLERTRRLNLGYSLSEITRDFCKAWRIDCRVIPMTDSRVRTTVLTDEGALPFQEYFVRRHCEPRVTGFRFDGIHTAEPAPGVLEEISSSDAIILCPSNPWVSIDPILSVPGIQPAVQNSRVVSISPIIQGRALKGPAAKMYKELGIEPSALAIANHFRYILTGIVFDSQDAHLKPHIEKLGIGTFTCNTIMEDSSGCARLARDVLHFIGSL
ncbi:MAG: 2-phospho-L-lactate transferase [Chloroflexi bacterium]|nr:2-phospho-L-lactate transferase [Chloroflexota bacterium]